MGTVLRWLECHPLREFSWTRQCGSLARFKRGGLLLSGKGGRTVKRLPLPRLRFSRRAVRAIAEDDDAQGNGLYKKRSRRNRPSPEIVRYQGTQWRRS